MFPKFGLIELVVPQTWGSNDRLQGLVKRYTEKLRIRGEEQLSSVPKYCALVFHLVPDILAPGHGLMQH